jgi:hypothetical protein
MKFVVVLAALAVGVSAQFEAPDLDKGKTREEIGRTSSEHAHAFTV